MNVEINISRQTLAGGEQGGLRWGSAGMQGWRMGMEDSHLACLDVRRGETSGPPPGTSQGTSEQSIAAFAVFDGHVSHGCLRMHVGRPCYRVGVSTLVSKNKLLASNTFASTKVTLNHSTSRSLMRSSGCWPRRLEATRRVAVFIPR